MNRATHHAAGQYLAHYAEPDTQLLVDWPGHIFDRAVLVPCYAESPAFFERLRRGRLWDARSLVIAVINEPDQGALPEASAPLEQYFADWRARWRQQHLAMLESPAGQLALVAWRQRGALRLPKARGVGLARKIGADLALCLWRTGALTSPWLHCTDADARLPARYFAPLPHGPSAYLFEFCHHPAADPAVTAATAQYERAIRYFARGLRAAGSAYGYVSLGSAMAIYLPDYARARGFPRRAGAEDFYLLNKLNKLNGVALAADRVVELESRASTRAPFGTGAKVATLLADKQPLCYFHPAVFECLRELLAALRDGRALSGLATPIRAAFENLGPEPLFRQLQQQPDRERALRQWLDGFKTLQFVRYLERHHYRPLPLTDAVRMAGIRP